MTGILGGTFDPPHNGHLALARAALEHFGLERLLVWVAIRPGHKVVELDGEIRLRLAQAAFAGVPRTEVVRDEHPFTIDTLRDGRWDDALLLIGADEFASFLDWKSPQAVLDHVRLAVATRPGFAREQVDAVLARLRAPERVELFEIEPVPVSSHELRARVARGEPIDELVPPAVARLVEELGLYRL